MNIFFYIIIGVIILTLLYVVITYNTFVRLNNRVKEGFSTMDVYLKKRWDLIPNIIETVKGYMKHEIDTLENIVSLRTNTYDKMSLSEKIDTNEKLESGISKLMMISENYPELKSNENFLDLSTQLSKVEDEIANSRKYYNAVVRNMNNKIQMIPSNIIAKLFGFKEIKMFEINEVERINVKVNF